MVRRLPFLLFAACLLGCTKNVGELAVQLVGDSELLKEKAKSIRVRVVGKAGEVARAEFDAPSGAGRIASVPTGSGLQIIVEALGTLSSDKGEPPVFALGRSVPLTLGAGDNEVTVFVGPLDGFSFTPDEQLLASLQVRRRYDTDGDAGPLDVASSDSPSDVAPGDGLLADVDGSETGSDASGDGLSDASSPDAEPDASPDAAEPDRGDFKRMNARAFHKAAHLGDKRLLLYGGVQSVWWPEGRLADTMPSLVSTAELLDESSLTFAPSRVLKPARMSHTVTRLSNGHVLVAGGVSGSGDVLAETAIFDSAANAFFADDPLVDARRDHAAAVVNGEALIAGGRDADRLLASVENLETGVTKSMSHARRNFALVVLSDGTLLAIGGFGCNATDMQCVASDGKPLATTEYLKPDSPLWIEGPTLEIPRAYPQVVVMPNDSVFVVGGLTLDADQNLVTTPIIERLDDLKAKQARSFGERDGQRLKIGRWAHTTTRLLNGKILVVGGLPSLDGAPQKSAEEIAVFEDGDIAVTKQFGPSMNRPRAGHTATLLRSGHLLVTGGISADASERFIDDSAEVFIYQY